MTLREFSGFMESLSSYVFRLLGIPERLSDTDIAQMYIDYEGSPPPAPAPQPMAVVVWSSRQAGTTVHLFSDRTAAETWARAKGHEFDRHGDYSEKRFDDGDLCIDYSCEGDTLTVSDIVPDKDLSDAA
ncbi:hypothetical protein C5E45_32910 [Nocardia nova]|uniref:Uncharacterized protein n=2 Tax=Nocardia nova TaxID=37330 RepID=A0A2S6ACS7_9NOCA|nr:hypothetical protein C5E45_32910 [Nocardia nova]